MHRIASWTATLVVLLATPVGAAAHPGHGQTETHPLVHYLAEPEHGVLLAVTAGVVAGTVMLWKAIRSRT